MCHAHQYQVFWTCIPYLQLSKSIQTILTALLEEKTLKLEKNPL